MIDKDAFFQSLGLHASRRTLLKWLGGTMLGNALWQWWTPTGVSLGQTTPTLTWENLKNTTYPSPWTATKRVTLKDGEFRSKSLANVGGEVQIFLSEFRVFGDLNGDGTQDAVVLLTTHAGGTYFLDLIPVLNQKGQPTPQNATFLGDRTAVKNLTIENGKVMLQAAELPPEAGDSVPDTLRTYVLRGKQLVLQSKQVMEVQTTETTEVTSQRVELTQANNTATPSTTLAGQAIHEYVVPAERGKMLLARLKTEGNTEGNTASNHLALSVYGRNEGQVLLSITDEQSEFQAETPSKQDYVIQVVNLSNLSSEYTLTIRLLDLVR